MCVKVALNVMVHVIIKHLSLILYYSATKNVNMTVLVLAISRILGLFHSTGTVSDKTSGFLL